MSFDLYTVEVQRDLDTFGDAQTIGTFNNLRTAMDRFDHAKGHRRLIGWMDLGSMRTPTELIRL